MKRTMLLVTVALVMAAMLVFVGPASAQSRAPGAAPYAHLGAGGCQEFGEFLSSEAHRQRGGEFGQEVSEDAQSFWPSLAVVVLFAQVSSCDVPS